MHDDEYGTFDSIKEYNRFKRLKIMENNGEISDLQRQVAFVLIPGQELSNGGFSLTFSIPAEYSDGIDFGSNGLPREGAATKTISVSASVHVRNPSNLDALPLTSNMIYFD